ncbi:hypothetical protein HDU76_012922 [Blyttiomyces sp. JEL0837]|nr:hypothetical protein HDU76_012922 [Blyttiomyces sp. JEL0837]
MFKKDRAGQPYGKVFDYGPSPDCDLHCMTGLLEAHNPLMFPPLELFAENDDPVRSHDSSPTPLPLDDDKLGAEYHSMHKKFLALISKQYSLSYHVPYGCPRPKPGSLLQPFTTLTNNESVKITYRCSTSPGTQPTTASLINMPDTIIVNIAEYMDTQTRLAHSPVFIPSFITSSHLAKPTLSGSDCVVIKALYIVVQETRGKPLTLYRSPTRMLSNGNGTGWIVLERRVFGGIDLLVIGKIWESACLDVEKEPQMGVWEDNESLINNDDDSDSDAEGDEGDSHDEVRDVKELDTAARYNLVDGWFKYVLERVLEVRQRDDVILFLVSRIYNYVQTDVQAQVETLVLSGGDSSSSLGTLAASAMTTDNLNLFRLLLPKLSPEQMMTEDGSRGVHSFLAEAIRLAKLHFISELLQTQDIVHLNTDSPCVHCGFPKTESRSLHHAAACGNVQVLRSLVDKFGTNIEKTPTSVMATACQHGKVAFIQSLVELFPDR